MSVGTSDVFCRDFTPLQIFANETIWRAHCGMEYYLHELRTCQFFCQTNQTSQSYWHLKYRTCSR